MANFETTPPVTTDCKQQSKRRCRCAAGPASSGISTSPRKEIEFWLDGSADRAREGPRRCADACRGADLGGEWRAPPQFDSLYMGFERYADTANDQDLWIDDVALAKATRGLPRGKGGRR